MKIILLNNKLQGNLVYFATVFVLIIIILWANYLPLVDLPQHAGQVAALDDILKNQNHPWSSNIAVNWDTPYLLGYSLILALYQVFEINTAINITVVVAFLSFLYTSYLLRKAYDASKMVDWIAIPSFFGFAFEWGFLTFILAFSIGLFFFLVNKQWVDSKKIQYLPIILILGVTLYFSHILIFAFFCYLSYFYYLLSECIKKNNDNYFFKLPRLKAFLQLTSIYLFFALLLVRYVSKEDSLIMAYGAIDGYQTNVITFTSIFEKFLELLYLPWSMSPTAISDNLMAVFGIIILLLPIILGYKIRKSLRFYFPLMAFLIMWLILPDRAFNTSFIYQRYASLFFIFYFLIWDSLSVQKLRSRQKLEIWNFRYLICAVIIGGVILKTPYNIIQFNKDAETLEFTRLIQEMKPNSRIAYFLDNDQKSSTQTISKINYIYLPLWYQAKYHGWADFNFAWFLPQIVRYKTDSVSEVTGMNYGNAIDNIINLRSCKLYDYIIVKTLLPIEAIQMAMVNSHCKEMNFEIKQQGHWIAINLREK